MTLALVLALGFHALLIFGLGWVPEPRHAPQPVLSLNVDLVQRAGGRPRPRAMAPAAPVAPAMPRPRVASDAQAEAASLPRPRMSAPSVADAPERNLSLSRTGTLDLAAQIRNEGRAKRLDLNAMTNVEGFYFEQWVRKVERVGARNFPAAAAGLSRADNPGPVLDVAVNADGGIHAIRLVESSGYPDLDRAARRIVRLAAPFAAFPPEMRQGYDVLHIVRRWQFRPGAPQSR